MLQQDARTSVLDQLTARANELYSLPEVAMRVLEITQSEPVDFGALRESVELDQSLVTKLLRVANSSFYGLRSEVSTLTHALNVIGSRMVRTLVLSFSLPRELTRGIAPRVLERYWRKTVCRAVAARSFGKAFGMPPIECEELFLAGMLQGVGLLVLMQEFGETYIQFREHVQDEGADLAEQEAAVFGFSHLALTGQMLQQWGLPKRLTQLVAGPRDTLALANLNESQRDLASTLFLADEAAEFLVGGLPSSLLRTLDIARHTRGIEREPFLEMLTALEAEVNSLGELFNLRAGDEGFLTRLIAEAHARLAGVERAATPVCPTHQPETKLLESVQHLKQDLANINTKMRAKLTHIVAPPSVTLQVDLQQLARTFPVLITRVQSALMRCRQERCALSLALIFLGDNADYALQRPEVRRLQALLHKACEHLTESTDSVERHGTSLLALLLENHERKEAVECARQLLEVARRFNGGQREPVKVSIGVATVTLPSRSFREHELIEAAVRCTESARRAEGDAVKSFEL